MNIGVAAEQPIALLGGDLSFFSVVQKSDYSFFNNFKSYRKLHPDQPFYILKPQMPWELWDIIQEISSEPSSQIPSILWMLGESMSEKDPLVLVSTIQ